MNKEHILESERLALIAAWENSVDSKVLQEIEMAYSTPIVDSKPNIEVVISGDSSAQS